MELSEVIKGRRSVRKFKPDPVNRSIIENVLELALWAPSAMNRQGWGPHGLTVWFLPKKKK